VPGASANGEQDDDQGDAAEAAPAEVPEEKLERQHQAPLPRTDISPLLNEQLMEQLGDKNWKERQAALERIDVILRENPFIKPNLSELPKELCKRFTDKNAKLSASALKICEKIAVALGSQGRRYVSAMAPGMISALNDNKETVRKAAVEALTAWFDNCGGIAPFLEKDMLLESLKKAVGENIKAEVCGWLSAGLIKPKPARIKSKSVRVPAGGSDLKDLIPIVFSYVEGKSQEVRAKATELIMPLMLHVGASDMVHAMNKLKVSFQFLN
jgi:cytoskeleton-associated protein 5